jgi:hypothetical protein
MYRAKVLRTSIPEELEITRLRSKLSAIPLCGKMDIDKFCDPIEHALLYEILMHFCR